MQSAALMVSSRPPSFAVAAIANPKEGPRSRSRQWWAPLFGWSGEADYIDEPAQAHLAKESPEDREMRGQRRFGRLTAEKARELRMKTMEMDSFHDAMYHSAIASRLASDLHPPPRSS